MLDEETRRRLLRKYATLMADNLQGVAGERGIDLSGLAQSGYKWQNWLDEAFDDDGTTRCLHFSDMSMPYASHFANFKTDEWFAHRWDCSMEAIRIIDQRIRGNSLLVWHFGLSDGWVRLWYTDPVVCTVDDSLTLCYYVITEQARHRRCEVKLSVISLDRVVSSDNLDPDHTWVVKITGVLYNYVVDRKQGLLVTTLDGSDEDTSTLVIAAKEEANRAHLFFDQTLQLSGESGADCIYARVQ